MTIKEKSTITLNEPFFLLKIIATVFSIILLRMFIENFSSSSASGYFFSWQGVFLHATLYFFAVFLFLAILTYIFTKEPVEKILVFLTKPFLFILLVPIIDLVLKGKVVLNYITLNTNELVPAFFKMLNPLSGQEITIGQYVAAYGIFLSIAFFVYKKTKNLYKGFLLVFSGYIILFVFAIIPSLLVAIDSSLASSNQPAGNLYNLILNQSWFSHYIENITFLDRSIFQTELFHEISMARIYFIFILSEVAMLLFLVNKKIWNSLKNNLRIERIFYWFIVAGIGITINQKTFGDLNLHNPINVIALITFLSLIALNAWLATFINDAEDINIDIISNPSRPLVSKTISIQQWNLMQVVTLILICFGVATMNRSTGFLFLVTQAAYYIYSAQPLRLKRHFIFSSTLTGLAAVSATMAGFFLVSPDQHISTFPLSAIFIIGISYGLISNLKDIKDFEGDKNEGMKTIPVVFGLKWAKRIISILCTVVLIAVPIILHLPSLFIFSICISLFLFYLFTKKEYEEKYIFLVLFLYLLILYAVAR